jgi:arylsulfatase A-like enzyme
VQKHFGVRTDRYKLIRFYGDGDFWELYDLQKDPNELRNVYENPAYAKVRKQLHAELLKQAKGVEDTEALQLLAIK